MVQTFNVELALEAQKKITAERKFPHFAPVDGRCYNCGENVYEPRRYTSKIDGEVKNHIAGISVQKASEELVTGCPHCHYSFCE